MLSCVMSAEFDDVDDDGSDKTYSTHSGREQTSQDEDIYDADEDSERNIISATKNHFISKKYLSLMT